LDNTEEYVITWEAPIIEKPEFRLYYDDKGNVVTYTCEKLDGDYIVIDTLTFAEARPDVRVVDGKLIRAGSGAVISRLYPNVTGILCEAEDVSIITEADGQYWKLSTINIT
jgi:hypothetical protein